MEYLRKNSNRYNYEMSTSDDLDASLDFFEESYSDENYSETFFDPTESDINFYFDYFTKRQLGGKSTKKKAIYKWKILEHNGVLFTPIYDKHNVPILYNGEKIILDDLEEEYATIYSKYQDTEYIKNSVFRNNFWDSWRKILGKAHKIQSLEDCDFSLIYKHVLKHQSIKKNMSKETKENEKSIRDKKEAKYKIAIIDGESQGVGNFRMEPPGLFIGRGCHPKMGTIKKRIEPGDITLNLGKDASIPKLPNEYKLKGHVWGKIIHDRTSEWLSSWIDSVTGKRKYVWLSNNSKFKSESDKKKFDLARKLKKNIGKIRQTMEDEMNHEEQTIRQAASALYMIDNFALRIGNEKGKDEADTVGVTSLRVEHVIFQDKNKITLDFLGKDSIRYKNAHIVSPVIYKNLKTFTAGKKPKEQLFNFIDSSFINKYLQSFMTNLTAKVFRTYNASNLFQKELNKINRKMNDDDDIDTNVNIVLDLFNKANIKVAVLCNHQKKVSSTFNLQLKKIDEQINLAKKKVHKLNRDQSLRIKKRKKKSPRDNERIKKIKLQIKEMKVKKKFKIELKSVSIETSKANYIDPRITIAFVKKHDLPVDKIFSKTLQEKFKWAFDVDEKWKF
jgi:DNA topoisomerase-1